MGRNASKFADSQQVAQFHSIHLGQGQLLQPGDRLLGGKDLGWLFPLKVVTPEYLLDRVNDACSCFTGLFAKCWLTCKS